jgi:hypothetical protein
MEIEAVEVIAVNVLVILHHLLIHGVLHFEQLYLLFEIASLRSLALLA